MTPVGFNPEFVQLNAFIQISPVHSSLKGIRSLAIRKCGSPRNCYAASDFAPELESANWVSANRNPYKAQSLLKALSYAIRSPIS